MPVSEVARHVISPTEHRNPNTEDIDRISVLSLLEVINDEDSIVAGAVRHVLPDLAQLVEATVERVKAGGHVHYFGAGTSGRLGVLDAAELPPTYGVPGNLFAGHLAGGDLAFRRAIEGCEDDEEQGRKEAAASVGPGDVVIGLAASGYTPYVGGALQQSQSIGAYTALITSNPDAPLATWADVALVAQTGPEVIAGSTRMKSATAQKLILNSFSTAVMVRIGRTWSNLMVDLTPTNAKLRGRLVELLIQATKKSRQECEWALAESGNEPKTALVALRADVSASAARAALDAASGIVASALDTLSAALD
jgi:N-acetylmuramic acid 6-phosphate etherase